MQPSGRGLSFVSFLGGDAAHTAHLPDCLQGKARADKAFWRSKGQRDLSIIPPSLGSGVSATLLIR